MLGLQYPGLYTPPPLVLGSAPPVFIVTTALPLMTPGQPYTATIVAQGGHPPYGFGIVVGQLPPGLVFSAAGVISGTPALPVVTLAPPELALALVDTPYHDQLSVTSTTTQTFPFTVRVLDGFNQYDDQDFQLTVWEMVGTITFTVDGCVPECLAVGPDGSIAGVPMQVGTFPLTFIATDSGGAPGSGPTPGGRAMRLQHRHWTPRFRNSSRTSARSRPRRV
jgi:hypothetical protein